MGDMVNGIPHGNGKYTDVNGDIMEGDFVDGMLHGYGRHERADGIVHEGDFLKGMAQMEGKVIMPNGAELAGDFVDGVMHGRLVGHYDKELQEERDERGKSLMRTRGDSREKKLRCRSGRST